MSTNPVNFGSGDLLDMLASDDLEDRLMAIEVLGETGDEEALSLLRQRLSLVRRELDVLTTAVDRLKITLAGVGKLPKFDILRG